MKLLVVNSTSSRRNGITNVAFSLIKSFNKADYEIGYVSVSEIAPEFEVYLKDEGYKAYILKRQIKRPLTYILQLAKIARGYNIMHVHGNSATMVLEMIAAKIAGVKIRGAHSHNTTCGKRMIDAFSRPLFHALCNLRLACGKEAGEWLFGKRDFIIIRNGIDCRKFLFNESQRDEMRGKLGWNNNFIIANVANFVEAKNHEFLIDVFTNIHNKLPDTRLLLLGCGPLMNDTINKTKEMGVYDRVFFAGNVPNIVAYLQSVDLIVMPSKHEGMPLTLVEEQANGLRAVVSDAITKDANLAGKIHFLPLKEGVRSWSSYIVSMIENWIDRNEATSRECIKKIEAAGYDIYSSAKELQKTFEDKLNECYE